MSFSPFSGLIQVFSFISCLHKCVHFVPLFRSYMSSIEDISDLFLVNNIELT